MSSGRRSKQKGKRGELEAAKALAECLGLEARRTQQYSGTEGTSDVVTPACPIHWEVKRTERLKLREAVEQAVGDSTGDPPVVLYRSNRCPWVAIIPLEALADVAQRIYLAQAAER